MTNPLEEFYGNDTTPSREVVQHYRLHIFDDDSDARLVLVHYRGGEDEFTLGKEYCASEDPGDRATGADVLAQLGCQNATFLKESVEILVPLLDDPDDFVVYSTAVALGHRGALSAVPALLKLVDHPDSTVRFGAVCGLTPGAAEEDPRAIDALIHLAADEDPEVRNWAVFGIGTQTNADSPEIRSVLRSALKDSDSEIRGEGLVGLAKRNDPGIVSALITEWNNHEADILSIEAAEETGDPQLYRHLMKIDASINQDDNAHLAGKLAAAIAACKPESAVNDG